MAKRKQDRQQDNNQLETVKREIKHRNRPDLAKFGYENTEPGDNTRYLRFARLPFSLPPIDISDPVQVENRINEYFNACETNDMKPNIVGLGNWLGVSRDTINNWKRGDTRNSTHSDMINKAIGMLEELWVNYMQNGKINPASGIFLGKNMFQYKDTQDIMLTPNNPLSDISVDEVGKKYKELPQD